VSERTWRGEVERVHLSSGGEVVMREWSVQESLWWALLRRRKLGELATVWKDLIDGNLQIVNQSKGPWPQERERNSPCQLCDFCDVL
jgi:hypothetical protein